MGSRVDAAGHATHHGEARSRQRSGKQFGLLQAIATRMARADDGNSETVDFLELTPHEQHSGRVGKFFQELGVTRIGGREDGNVVLGRQAQLLVDVDLRAAWAMRLASVGPMPETYWSSPTAAASTAAGELKCASSRCIESGPTPGTMARVRRSRSWGSAESIAADNSHGTKAMQLFSGAIPVSECRRTLRTRSSNEFGSGTATKFETKMPCVTRKAGGQK